MLIKYLYRKAKICRINYFEQFVVYSRGLKKINIAKK